MKETLALAICSWVSCVFCFSIALSHSIWCACLSQYSSGSGALIMQVWVKLCNKHDLLVALIVLPCTWYRVFFSLWREQWPCRLFWHCALASCLAALRGLSLAPLCRWLWLVWCFQGVCCLLSLAFLELLHLCQPSLDWLGPQVLTFQTGGLHCLAWFTLHRDCMNLLLHQGGSLCAHRGCMGRLTRRHGCKDLLVKCLFKCSTLQFSWKQYSGRKGCTHVTGVRCLISVVVL